MRVEQKTGVQIHGGFEHLINSEPIQPYRLSGQD